MPHTIAIGNRLGDFEIVGQLGKGGAGIVYRAKHTVSQRDYALKTLTATTVVNEDIHKRFIREIAVAQKLKHDNVVAFHECGLHEDVLFYTMELVPWGTLQEVLAKRRFLPWREAVECGIDICRGLEHLHEHHIVHRDLKPGNIFLSDDGQLKLGDFGLVRDQDSSRLTLDGITVGTAKYLSPEQAMAKSEIDGRSDLYALGCILFEMLAGRPPFLAEGGTGVVNYVELMEKHVEEAPPDIKKFVKDCPNELAGLIQRLLAKNPDDRPASALDVESKLDSILNAPHELALAQEPSTFSNTSDIEAKSLTKRLLEQEAAQPKINKRAIIVVLAVILVALVIFLFKTQNP